VLVALLLVPSVAFGAGVLTTGKVNMGVGDNAGLGALGVGLNLIGGPGDSITPGCLCEGWGAAANGDGAHHVYGLAGTGVSSSTFTAGGTPDAATVDTLLTNGLRVVHSYSSAASGDLFRINITMTNETLADMTDVRYARTLDWDVPPGHFSEDFLTIFVPGGAPAGKVLHTSSNPFDVPNPMVTRTAHANTNLTDLFGGDRGGYFILGFGDLAAGASTSFDTYIGADFTEADLEAAFASVGIEAFTHSRDDNGPATFGWGFAGVGLPPALPPPGGGVPAPSTAVLLGAGLVGLALLRRRLTT
jgi:type IV pilus assembly protein PilY1